MTRPPSIVLFERVYLASIALGLIGLALSWDAVVAGVRADTPQLGGAADGVLMVSVALSIVIPLILWYFVARRASNVAKWIVVALTAIGLLMFVSGLADPAAAIGPMLLFGVANTALQLFAAWLLFKPDAKAWLEGGLAAGTDDPTIGD